MKRLLYDDGGRPPMNDDFAALQQLTLFSAAAPWLGLPTCVLSGGAVTAAGGTYNVAPAFVWLADAGQLYDFQGAQGVELPATFQLGTAVVVDQRPYQTGGTKPCITETQAVLVSVAAGDPFAVDAEGPVFWYDHTAARTRIIGELKPLAINPANFDNTGKGKGRNRGWCYANGQNGTVDMSGVFPLGVNAANPLLTQRAVGDTGGEETHQLTVPELPRHNHAFNVYDNGDNGAFGRRANNTGTARGAITNDAGSDQPHNNMPPFRVVAWCQWMGL
ncbi:hypothetical protein LJ737_19975 [Hymenobacter sp. 15J16-1T3B]|uniref:hypothetical protein n=1 Tax=Hymenobacter sp. 15J16-1T3B TaxID=2886941 RepID=UPI001D11F0D1|nr:hypothetical protein [Hymenobacter sp. 15J16-1T3B]MCC3159531.1 hypothetical protein [Hymenobacter sp. 15J16-1T3B]